ncbi:OmpA family protein [Massilia sp. NEAU-DD11]|uniref:OmpA family protein n=1 Tax=Massilia cellulosiltytica TaxID=2683234 RepID=A0A7X3G6E3_9BURK|nr:OmpA family protein [Telluria cellulosilytica]MVW64478.1 OmpA family protein [Telluria cellulosilytica]
MKTAKLCAVLASGVALCACATLSPAGTVKSRVSADYEAAGGISGMRAFIYGRRTVLELPSRPLWLSIQDENGVTVPYEREGRYYRLTRTLDRFTVRANTRVLSFSRVTERAPIAANAPLNADPASRLRPVNDVAPPTTSAARVGAELTSEEDAVALLRIAVTQLEEVRQTIAAGGGSDAEATALNARLDRIEAQLFATGTTLIRVQFDTRSTDFRPNDEFVRTLIPAAKAAQRINLRGRTDARIAGRDDPGIALGRALAVRRYLVDHGIDDGKIKVFARAAGDFLAPSNTDAGRALNRRVEIEFVDARYAALKPQAIRGSGTTP